MNADRDLERLDAVPLHTAVTLRDVPVEAWLESLWALYGASGYFALAGKTAQHFETLRRDFFAFNRRAVALPHLSCVALWLSERGVEASLSALKLYPHAWLLHQLGRLPGRFAHAPGASGRMLSDVYRRTVEHALADPQGRWLFAYIESSVPFIRRTHALFAERMAASGQAVLMDVRLMEAECGEPSGAPLDGWEIVSASGAERELLAREIARTRPAAYAEALELTPGCLGWEGAAREWGASGLRRERCLLVARRQGLPLAVLVLESGPAGSNLFRLLDSARLFCLCPEGREAYGVLLDAARAWFARRGRSGFVYVCEDDGGYADAARLHDDASTRPQLWILSAALAPAFLAHIDGQSAGVARAVAHAVAQGDHPMEVLKQTYEPHVRSARGLLETHPALLRLLSPSLEPLVLERFLIEWMARAAYMTEPVDGWIRRTGARCQSQGMEQMGSALIVHAKSETGHHLMTIEDAHALVAHWNAQRPGAALSVEQLTTRPPTRLMKAYRQLHEDTIEGEHPVGQVSIEREVGYLAVHLLPPLLAQVERLLGADAVGRLTFLAEHAAVDVGHTLLNEKMLAEAISRAPEHARIYAETGAQALETYIHFLDECLARAEQELSGLRSVA